MDGLKLETFGNKTLTSKISLENMFAIFLPSIPPVIFGYHADFPGAITSVARTPACMHDATGSLLWNYEACRCVQYAGFSEEPQSVWDQVWLNLVLIEV